MSRAQRDDGDAELPRHGRRAQVWRRADSVIRPRPRATGVPRIALCLVFALLGTPILMSGRWAIESVEFRAGDSAPVTVRLPMFLRRPVDDARMGLTGAAVREGTAAGSGSEAAIVVGRGERVEDASWVVRAREVQPTGWGARLTFLIALLLIGVLYTEQLRRSHKGRLLRTQAALLGLQLGIALLMSAALLMTPVAAVALPVAALVIMTALVVDLGAALATALVAALLCGALTPFDPGVMTVMAVQGACAALFLGDRPRRVTRMRMLAAGAVGGGAAALCYFLIYSLAWNQPPAAELAAPLGSAWVAAGAAGVVGALVAMACLAPFQRLVGDIPLGALIELEDLSHPLLKQIAEGSPGTWQHSLAMANMAQIAANAIGADGRLVRVGAYYHDLGKSIQPKYFIENLSGGEASPHDALPPRASCEAIFGHVTEGVKLARRQRLHERVIDFMHMHHGDGLLEYFWVKCQEQGNPERLTEADFRYPGVKPGSKETAILAICDAVEAASRTLRGPDPASIEALVQRIVYGKLHLGQLDDSGLTMADLRVISNSLMDTIKHAHHGRIEYQWQRQKREEEAAAGTPAPGRRPNRPRMVTPSDPDSWDGDSATQRLLREPRLDSLDAPRPVWRARSPSRITGGALENALTEPMPSEVALMSSETRGPALTRPPTAAEVARVTADMIVPPAPAEEAEESERSSQADAKAAPDPSRARRADGTPTPGDA